MSQYYAIANSRNIGCGTAFTIQSGVLRRLDLLDLQLEEDGKVEAVIERFDSSGLSIRLNGSICRCRPWQMGDAAVRRLPGTVSSWTIDQILEAAEEAVGV
jgi:hypothetical protein